MYRLPPAAHTPFPGFFGSRGLSRDRRKEPRWAIAAGVILRGLASHHEGAMAGKARRRWIRSKMAANILRGTATSAIWKNTYFK